MLINTVNTNQRTWFPAVKVSEKDDIRQGFQPFVEHGVLHLYCPLGASNDIHMYSGKMWMRGSISPSIFTPGKNIRLAIKIQGLSFHQHPLSRTWTGKFRLQHRILAVMTAQPLERGALSCPERGSGLTAQPLERGALERDPSNSHSAAVAT
jgi:hypothetical protein